MIVAVIPARGGSKRIPRKNVKHFRGKPMIAWSIEAAQNSGIFDRIVVSTDDAEIKEIAKSVGAEVPFMRPENLADDHTPTVPVIAHAIEAISAEASMPETVCCIYACAPFILATDLKRAYDEMTQTGSNYAFPVTSFPFPIQRAVKLTNENRVEMFHPEFALTRSQDLEEAYHDVGQFYFGKTEAWLEGKTVMGPDSTAIQIPRTRAQDIDTLEDWASAEALFDILNLKS